MDHQKPRMDTEVAIWRAAFRLVHRYGNRAGPRTAQRLLRELENGNPSAQATWSRLLDAVSELQDIDAPPRRPN